MRGVSCQIPDLDTIDCHIISELQSDGRLSNVELADRVGLSPSPCLRRIKRLETSGYIEGYRATLKRELVGLGFSVFLSVKLNEHANERVAQFEKTMVALPEVIACHLVSGEADYLLEIAVADLARTSYSSSASSSTCLSCARSAAISRSRR